MVLHLYWMEPESKWRSRGYANNQHLIVDYTNKCYDFRTEMVFPKWSDNEVEVKDKAGLKRYVGYLNKHGYKVNKNLT